MPERRDADEPCRDRSCTVGHPVLRERGRGSVTRRRAGLARRSQRADRRPDRHDARRQRRRHRRQPGRRAGAHRGDRGRPQPALPVQAADPADRRRQPGHRAARRRDGRDQRGLPVGARTCAATCSATSTCGCATSTATASTHDEVKRGPDGRHVPARVRPPRRRCCSSTASPTPTHAHDVGAVRALPPRRLRRAHHRVRRPRRVRRPVDGRVLLRAGAGSAATRAAAGVLVDVDGGRITGVTTVRRRRRRGRCDCAGLTCPGWPTPTATPSTGRCAGARTARRTGSFWTWREQMYARRRARSTPTRYHRAGARRVRRDGAGRHHRRRRVPLPPPRRRRASATPTRTRWARRSSPRPTRPASGSPCSTRATSTAGIGAEPDGACSGGSATATADAWAERATALDAARTARRVRDRRGDPLRARRRPGRRWRSSAAWADERGAPLHAHVSEQPAENERLPRRPRPARPTELLGRSGALGDAVHGRARHPPRPTPTSAPRRRRCYGAASARRPSATWPTASARRRRSSTPAPGCALGSDSHAVIDLFEEARGVELDERLRARRARHHRRRRPARGRPPPTATPASAGPRPGAIAVGRAGRPGDRRPRLGAHSPATDPTRVLDGRRVRGHRRRRAPRRRRRRGRRRRRAPPSDRRRRRAATASIGVGRGAHVVTTPTLSSTTSGCSSPTTRRSATGRSASSDDASVVIDGDRIVAVGAGRAPLADRRIDAGGRCVIPGFVDSHTHLVFAGDRGRRVRGPHGRAALRRPAASARPSPPPGRRPTTSCAGSAAAPAAPRRAGRASRRSRSSPGYGLTVADEARCLRRRRASSPTRRRSSAPTSCPPSSRAGPTTTSTSCAARCSPRRRPHARWIDAFCERGAFDADQCRAVLAAGRDAGLGLRAPRQPARPRARGAARGGDGLRVGRPLHLPRPTTTSTRWPAARPWRRSCRPPTSPPASPTRTPGG